MSLARDLGFVSLFLVCLSSIGGAAWGGATGEGGGEHPGPVVGTDVGSTAVSGQISSGGGKFSANRGLVRREAGGVGIYLWKGTGACPWEAGPALHIYFRRAELVPGTYRPTLDNVPDGISISWAGNPDNEVFFEPKGAVTIAYVEADRVTGNISLGMDLSGPFDVARQKGCGAISANFLEEE